VCVCSLVVEMADNDEPQESDDLGTRIDSLRPIKATLKSKNAYVQPAVVSQAEQERQEWAKQMRLKFTPKDMITQDGAINEEYVIKFYAEICIETMIIILISNLRGKLGLAFLIGSINQAISNLRCLHSKYVNGPTRRRTHL